MRHKVLCAAGKTAVRISVTTILILLVLVLVCAVILYVRHRQQQVNEGAVDAPGLVGDAEPLRTGSFTAAVHVTDLVADDAFTVDIPWDDSWFFADPARYNAQLAYTSSVLAALAYAESGYYQQGSDQPAYMELALGELGFTRVSTESYRYRSEIVDEVLSLVTQTADAAAYTIASKPVINADGSEEADLIMVSIRGSYGSEWLSNLEILFEQGEQAAEADRAIADAVVRSSGSDQITGTADDHPGYTEAVSEIADELTEWIGSSHDAGRKVRLLITGHSRGGAIANLLAARLLDGASGPLADGDDVYAYTLATPATTLDDDAHAERYAGIFNIVSDADIMTHLPLQTWGYERYGVDRALPSEADETFDAAYRTMATAFEEMAGVACPVGETGGLTVRKLVDDLSERIESIDALKTPVGVAQAFGILAEHVDPATILNGHYPSVYIAWMQALVARGEIGADQAS